MLPEVAVEGMQEPCADRQCTATSPTLEVKQEPPDLSPIHWTPENFLQSTLLEGNGVVNLTPVCDEQGDERFPEQIKDKRDPQTTKTTKTRRKQQWKLKFHHQALPPEYLDHYEASLSKTRPMATPPSHTTSSAAQTDSAQAPFYNLNHLPNESIQNWLQRIASLHNNLQKGNAPVNDSFPSTSKKKKQLSVRNVPLNNPQSSKVVNYKDLPYMGEMTLNNSKPRRGRKPKKADICHLIYKNYGTIFPGTPGHLMDDRVNGDISVDKSIQVKSEFGEKPETVVSSNKQRTDLQNKIISSLLEKRLSQESKKHKDNVKIKRNKCVQQEEDLVADVDRIQVLNESPLELPNHSEPLNLCIRDLNNLKIRLLRKHGNVYTKANVDNKVELDKSDNELESLSEVKSSIDSFPSTSVPDRINGSPKPGVIEKINNLDVISSGESDVTTSGKVDLGAESPLPGGYVYWPNAGVFVHPLALQSQLLYYQGLAAGNSYTVPPESSPDSPSSSKLERSTPQSVELEQRKSPTECSETSTASLKVKRGSTTKDTSTPAKRKRSAIFIPPMPAENTSSPATEVSICKFKFTGGARPSLQEKKMLSVDSGGNFRYYSGTGDKANRGYEFFPRESLQQSVGVGQGSAAGGTPLLSSPANNNDESAKKKRKSRKSIQREKLEKTFKEKGFLIQTQQLESAEGATYCKFRQLRKFTRYLFRSWKDYLPGVNQEADCANLPVAALPPASTGSIGAEWV